MPREVRLTAKQVRQLTGKEAVAPAKVPVKPSARPVQPRKPVQASETVPAVGKRYRVARGLRDHFVTPPPIGTVLTIWWVSSDGRLIYMEGTAQDTVAETVLSITPIVLRDFFTEEVSL